MNQTAKRIVAFTTLISFTASNTLAAIPNLQSIQGVNPDGQYNQGDTVDLTAKFDDFISPSPGTGLTVTLDVGPTTVDVPLTYSADSLVDRSFGVPGTLNATGKGDTNSEGIVMATELKQGDNAGRIVIVGSFTSYEGTTGQAKIMVLNPDGTIYRTFNADASQFTASNVQAVFETSEGKILVGGEFQNAWGNSNYDFLVQLNADFTLDTTFMNNVTANGTERGFNGQVGSSGTYGGANYYSANDPIIEHNGRLYITGDFDQVAGESYEFVTCLNLDGTRCSGFSSPFSFGTRGMTLAIDGDKLWVGGQNMYCGGYQDLWRLNLDGSVDTTYVDRLGGDLIGGVVVLPEVSDGGTGGVAISGNSLDMASHVSSTDGSTVPTANNKPLFVINDDGTRNTLWDVQGEKFAAEPWSGEGFQLVKGKLFFGMHYVNNDLAADDVRDTAGYYRNLDSVDCPANTTNGNNSTSDTCGLSSLIVFNTEDGSVNSEFMDVIGAQGAFIKDDYSDDIHDFELLSDGGLLVVGSFSSYRAEDGDSTFDDEAMIVKFRFDQLTGSYTVQSPATDLTGLVKTTGISSYQVQSIFDTAADTDGASAYNTLVANEETLQDNSRYAFNRVLASAIELYAEDNTNPEPVLSDYTDLGVTGVTGANIAELNTIVDSLNGEDLDTTAEVQDMVNAVNDAVIRSKAILAQIGSEADEPDTVESVVTVEQLRQILPAVDGVVDDNEALYQTYIDSRPNAFSEPATVGQVQIMIDRVNASQEALLEILEDSAAEDGANNANGEAVTVQEIASITGITGVNFDLEDEYQAAIAAETDFSNPPTLEEVQAVIDQVNAANTNQAPGNPGTDEVAPDGSLESSKSAGSVSLLWIMLAMLLVLARVLRNRRWLSPVAALLAVSSAAVAEEGKGLESLWVSVGEPEETALAENSKSDQPEEISRLYLTGGGLYSQFSPSSDGVDVESESDTGFGLGLGYDISDQLSVEASYLSHGEFRVVNNADNNEAALDYSSANIRLNWFPQFIGNQDRHAGYSRDGVFSWFLSAGLNYVMGDVTGPVDIDKDQSVVLGYGAGIAYGLTDQLDTFLSFNRISGDLDSVSAGGRFHFGLEQPAASNIPVAVPSVTAFVEPTVLSTPQPEMAVLPDCISCTPVGSVFFAFDSSALSDEFYPMLEELLQRISNDEFRGSILIVGFADSLGSSDYNLALAHRRAKAVSGYLIDHGLDRFLIDVDSEGRLLTPNILEASKRRVDIFVKNADLKPVSWID